VQLPVKYKKRDEVKIQVVAVMFTSLQVEVRSFVTTLLTQKALQNLLK